MLPPRQWQNRIVGHGEEEAAQLLANPRNWRIHPKRQQDAIAGVLSKIGWVQDVIVNQRTGFVVDGHARVALAISAGERVPVVYVDLSEEEEAAVLATFDPLGAMAGKDDEIFKDLVAGMDEAYAALAGQAGDIPAPGGAANPSLSERFGVPPFSVLDARQGYWQERKRAWLALGIQSELGRGDNLAAMGGQSSGVKLSETGGANGLTWGNSEAMRHPSLNHYREQRRAPEEARAPHVTTANGNGVTVAEGS